jgi:CheY-like chemotaxis protein
MLPKVSGVEVLRTLTHNAATRDIPVLVLTGLSERNKNKLLAEGAAGFVEKSDKLLENGAASLLLAIEQLRK